MKRKASEVYLRGTIKKSLAEIKGDGYPFWLEKIADSWNSRFAKSEYGGPDFMFSPAWQWVECIQSTGALPHNAVSEKQIEVMQRDGGWVYAVVGPGKAPNNKRAFLIPFSVWMFEVNKSEFKSFAWPTKRSRATSIDVFKEYECPWHDGAFVIPHDHEWWKFMYEWLDILRMMYGLRRQSIYDVRQHRVEP